MGRCSRLAGQGRLAKEAKLGMDGEAAATKSKARRIAKRNRKPTVVISHNQIAKTGCNGAGLCSACFSKSVPPTDRQAHTIFGPTQKNLHFVKHNQNVFFFFHKQNVCKN